MSAARLGDAAERMERTSLITRAVLTPAPTLTSLGCLTTTATLELLAVSVIV